MIATKISKKCFFSINTLNIIVICFLIFIGFEIGMKLADFIYYDVLMRADPFQGPTSFRILITSLFAGIVSSLLGATYAKLVKAKRKYISYAIAYASLILMMVASRWIESDGFPLGMQFWAHEIGVFVLTSAIILAIFNILTKK